jgi:hypothetical protein
MAFKLKDLIISLQPEEEDLLCAGLTARRCLPPSMRVTFCRTASPPIIILPECAWTAGRLAGEEPCTWTAGRESVESPEGLASLKQQLEQVLAQLDGPESAPEEPQLPRTLAEAEELEGRLREALEELRRHKAGLK